MPIFSKWKKTGVLLCAIFKYHRDERYFHFFSYAPFVFPPQGGNLRNPKALEIETRQHDEIWQNSFFLLACPAAIIIFRGKIRCNNPESRHEEKL